MVSRLFNSYLDLPPCSITQWLSLTLKIAILTIPRIHVIFATIASLTYTFRILSSVHLKIIFSIQPSVNNY